MFIHALNLELSKSSSTTESGSEEVTTNTEFNCEKLELEDKKLKVKESYRKNRIINWNNYIINWNKIFKKNNLQQCDKKLYSKSSNYSSL